MASATKLIPARNSILIGLLVRIEAAGAGGLASLLDDHRDFQHAGVTWNPKAWQTLRVGHGWPRGIKLADFKLAAFELQLEDLIVAIRGPGGRTTHGRLTPIGTQRAIGVAWDFGYAVDIAAVWRGVDATLWGNGEADRHVGVCRDWGAQNAARLAEQRGESAEAVPS